MMYVYWFDQDERWGKRVEEIFAAMRHRGDVLCSSLFILSEVLVGPSKTGDTAAISAIEQFFHANTEVLPYTSSAVRTFAKLRAEQQLKPLDALHLATADAEGVDAFLTDDRRLQKVIVPGISFIASIESEFF